MYFRIADTFTVSLARLTNDEQKLVKTTAFDLQLNPANPGHQLHKLDRAKDKQFWSVRVGRDVRLIVHKSADSLLLCYVGHHDDAYTWAERRKIERHPTTGAAQLVEIRERVQEIAVPKYVDVPPDKVAQASLFFAYPDDQLLQYGVPPEWLGDVRAATDATLPALIDHLPQEAAEALFTLATGYQPPVPQTPEVHDGFDHPAAQQRFRLMTDVDALKRALDAPWEQWAIFLHPDQQTLVQKKFNGPARVVGSAGTGKTVVALHRAVWLAKNNAGAKVLLTTFSPTLAAMLRARLTLLVGAQRDVSDRIAVADIDSVGMELYQKTFGRRPNFANEGELKKLLRESTKSVGVTQYSASFLWAEWANVVNAWQLRDLNAYCSVPRLGRKLRLTEKQRVILWTIFANLEARLADRKFTTSQAVFTELAGAMKPTERPFDFVVVDEAQDISVAQLRFLAALAGDKPNGLMFTGDLGQRIFQTPFSWKSVGADVRGRSHTLRVNYRTSHQIRRQADRLLPKTVADVDGIGDERSRTVSVFNGPAPSVLTVKNRDQEAEAVAVWLTERFATNVTPSEAAVFVRSEVEIERAVRAVKLTGKPHRRLNTADEPEAGIAVATMHEAKGLEFKVIVAMACDDEVVPSADRIESAADESELKEIYDSERQLLYVACTRARDHLLVTGVHPASEFLDDLGDD